jgi:hypothetical protein
MTTLALAACLIAALSAVSTAASSAGAPARLAAHHKHKKKKKTTTTPAKCASLCSSTLQQIVSMIDTEIGRLAPTLTVAAANTANTARTAGSANTANTATNANNLGGQPPSAYAAAPHWVYVDKDGTILAQSGGASVVVPGGGAPTGFWDVSFGIPLPGHAIMAMPLATNNDGSFRGPVLVAPCGFNGETCGGPTSNDGTHVLIDTENPANNGVVAHAFEVIVF